MLINFQTPSHNFSFKTKNLIKFSHFLFAVFRTLTHFPTERHVYKSFLVIETLNVLVFRLWKNVWKNHLIINGSEVSPNTLIQGDIVRTFVLPVRYDCRSDIQNSKLMTQKPFFNTSFDVLMIDLTSSERSFSWLKSNMGSKSSASSSSMGFGKVKWNAREK